MRERQRLYEEPGSKKVHFVNMPHNMFYAPNLTSKDIGGGPIASILPTLASYYLAALNVPAMVVVHILIFAYLLRRGAGKMIARLNDANISMSRRSVCSSVC